MDCPAPVKIKEVTNHCYGFGTNRRLCDVHGSIPKVGSEPESESSTLCGTASTSSENSLYNSSAYTKSSDPSFEKSLHRVPFHKKEWEQYRARLRTRDGLAKRHIVRKRSRRDKIEREHKKFRRSRSSGPDFLNKVSTAARSNYDIDPIQEAGVEGEWQDSSIDEAYSVPDVTIGSQHLSSENAPERGQEDSIHLANDGCEDEVQKMTNIPVGGSHREPWLSRYTYTTSENGSNDEISRSEEFFLCKDEIQKMFTQLYDDYNETASIPYPPETNAEYIREDKIFIRSRFLRRKAELREMLHDLYANFSSFHELGAGGKDEAEPPRLDLKMFDGIDTSKDVESGSSPEAVYDFGHSNIEATNDEPTRYFNSLEAAMIELVAPSDSLDKTLLASKNGQTPDVHHSTLSNHAGEITQSPILTPDVKFKPSSPSTILFPPPFKPHKTPKNFFASPDLLIQFTRGPEKLIFEGCHPSTGNQKATLGTQKLEEYKTISLPLNIQPSKSLESIHTAEAEMEAEITLQRMNHSVAAFHTLRMAVPQQFSKDEEILTIKPVSRANGFQHLFEDHGRPTLSLSDLYENSSISNASSDERVEYSNKTRNTSKNLSTASCGHDCRTIPSLQISPWQSRYFQDGLRDANFSQEALRYNKFRFRKHVRDRAEHNRQKLPLIADNYHLKFLHPLGLGQKFQGNLDEIMAWKEGKFAEEEHQSSARSNSLGSIVYATSEEERDRSPERKREIIVNVRELTSDDESDRTTCDDLATNKAKSTLRDWLFAKEHSLVEETIASFVHCNEAGRVMSVSSVAEASRSDNRVDIVVPDQVDTDIDIAPLSIVVGGITYWREPLRANGMTNNDAINPLVAETTEVFQSNLLPSPVLSFPKSVIKGKQVAINEDVETKMHTAETKNAQEDGYSAIPLSKIYSGETLVIIDRSLSNSPVIPPCEAFPQAPPPSPLLAAFRSPSTEEETTEKKDINNLSAILVNSLSTLLPETPKKSIMANASPGSSPLRSKGSVRFAEPEFEHCTTLSMHSSMECVRGTPAGANTQFNSTIKGSPIAYLLRKVSHSLLTKSNRSEAEATYGSTDLEKVPSNCGSPLRGTIDTPSQHGSVFGSSTPNTPEPSLAVEGESFPHHLESPTTKGKGSQSKRRSHRGSVRGFLNKNKERLSRGFRRASIPEFDEGWKKTEEVEEFDAECGHD